MRDGRTGLSKLLSRAGLAALLLGSATGCVKPAQVKSDELPVTRVVVYRNGVAYFERSGSIHHSHVEFQLREENVGDFLATLAIMERGGQTVKAASFPVSLAEIEEGEMDPDLQRALDAWEHVDRDPRKLRKVRLELEGHHRHDLRVGYLAETPLWRPSYRLVVGDDGTASLQVWGIVQNQSGEDWSDVEIALVAGAPIAFESTLGDPVIPVRPVVTDRGEVIQAVPEGGATYHRESAPAEEMDEAEYAADLDDGDAASAYGSGYGRAGSSTAASKPMKKRSSSAYAEEGLALQPGQAPRPAPAPSASSMAPRNEAQLAHVEVQSGATRYEVPHTVTIPDESATMVLLVSKKVTGEAVHLYAPDGGVPDSQRHPFRVARFKNESGGLLEKGPIAVFEEGAFLGQGMLSSLPVKAEATVPFAVMRDIAVESSVSYDERDVRFYAVRRGNLLVERDRASLTTYKIQNGDQKAAKLLIKHMRVADWELHDPPEGTKDAVNEGAAYVPVSVPKFGDAEVVVEERHPVQSTISWESLEARRAIGQYLDSGEAKPESIAQLKKILEQAEILGKANDQERKLRREQRELEGNARETRLSIKAIEKNQSAAKLRAELTKRLAETTRRLDEITKELVEVGLRKSEAEVRMKEARQSLEIPPKD